MGLHALLYGCIVVPEALLQIQTGVVGLLTHGGTLKGARRCFAAAREGALAFFGALATLAFI